MIREIIIERLIRRLYLVNHLVKTRKRPLVKLAKLIERYHFGVRVKALVIIKITENIARCIAYLAVALGELLKHILGNADIRVIVERRYPQAQNIRAEVLDDLLGEYLVTLGLVHLLTVSVDYPAVSADRLVRRLTRRRDGCEQTRLKPAAVLIAALQVHIRGPRKLGTLLENSRVRAARIEPYVENIHFLAEFIVSALALHIRGNELARVLCVPRI